MARNHVKCVSIAFIIAALALMNIFNMKDNFKRLDFSFTINEDWHSLLSDLALSESDEAHKGQEQKQHQERPHVQQEQQQQEEEEHREKNHNPRNYSDNIQLNIDRGMNIISWRSGQRLASWIYAGIVDNWRRPYYKNIPGYAKKKLSHPDEAAKMKDNDTIFVNYLNIGQFTREFLPRIETSFVLITTTNMSARIATMEQYAKPVAPNITSHPHLLRWFATNIDENTGGYHYHHLVSPFPRGLKDEQGKAAFRNPLPYYREAFLRSWYHQNETEFQAKKKRFIFSGFISNTNANRTNITSTNNMLRYPKYLQRIIQSKYVISPAGIHPDCHRHYEAIGLGAVPITDIDPYLYSHLKEGPIIYNTSTWNQTELKSILGMKPISVKRTMIFEEYWVEYMERIVGRPLRWWDVVQNRRATREEFAFNTRIARKIIDSLNL
mmetsp:Transcript_22720/g.34361  ORF Transcript_22720/g.34361 Transcript_22720/m.34361 type:complete len:438 (+) Transcript_22720:33-1346(+)